MGITWTPDVLDGLRRVGDPPVDELVGAYLATAGAQAADLFRALVGAGADHPDLARYQADDDALPAWADPVRMAKGADFFAEWGLEIGMGLFCFSLPAGYAASRIAHVLDLTARLETDARRRIFETAQMVLDATTPGGLAPGAPGYVAARRVRLMHAGIRSLIAQDPRVSKTPVPDGHYWCEDWGVPINQEHLIATVLAFGWAMLGVLDKLHISYDPDAADAYLHLWDVVGHLMGVRDGLLPLSPADAPVVQALIEERNFAASPAGQRMTDALVGVMNEAGPGLLLRGLPVALMRQFLGDRVADIAGVPASNWTRVLVNDARPLLARLSADALYDRGLRRMTQHASRAVMQAFVRVERGPDRPPFAVPTHLGWDL
jgi:hypothetical protein